MSEQPETLRLEDLPDDEDGFYACEEGDDHEPFLGARFGTTSRHVLATWLDDAFRKWGVRFKYVEGWESRGRPMSSGYFDPNALLVHHTGTTSSATKPAPSLNTVTVGRSDLTGPLCQISTDYNGLTYIVAAGRANHAGTSRAAMGNPSGDGNAMYLGNEVQTSGTQRMPAAQYDALVLSSAAVLDHFGYTSATKLGLHHTTSTSGKWDLGAGTGAIAPYDLTKFRADVTARLAAGPGTTPTPPEEEDMPTVGEIWAATVGGASDPHSVATALVRAERDAAAALAETKKANVSIAALSEAVKALSTSTGVDPDTIAANVDKAVRDRLDRIDFTVTDTPEVPA
jgi:hypothetical protein